MSPRQGLTATTSGSTSQRHPTSRSTRQAATTSPTATRSATPIARRRSTPIPTGSRPRPTPTLSTTTQPSTCNDLGVLVLDDPVVSDEYGQLPEEGLLTSLEKQKSKLLFEAVGYGLEGSKLNSSFGGDTRRKAQQRLVNLKGVGGAGGGISAKFSSNKGKNTTGGTCFGDSGGPIFLEPSNTIVAVTSYGISPTCSDGTGGYRVDQADDLDFLATFGVTP